MIVTPFGDIDPSKPDQIQYWLDSHDARHSATRQAIARTGVPLFAHSFQGPMSKEWLGRHMIEHTTLKDFAVPDSSVTSVLLESSWDDPQTASKWHQVHNLLHQRLDEALGLNR